MNILVILIVIILDQIGKYLAKTYLINGGKVLIENFFYLTYLENRGAAFGILQDSRIFFIIFTIIVLILLVYISRKYDKDLEKSDKIALSLIFGGAIGNFIDRLFHSYVVDFIGIIFPNGYNFPIFNIADIAITLGAFYLIIKAFISEIRSKKEDEDKNV